MQKAMRMVDPSIAGFEPRGEFDRAAIEELLRAPTDQRIFAIARALHDGIMTVDEIHDVSKIDKWFLSKLQNVVDLSHRLSNTVAEDVAKEDVLLAKRLGFCDSQIAQRLSLTGLAVRQMRTAMGVTPCVKLIDTVAGEFPAMTNYLFLTYNGTENDVEMSGGAVMVLGSGVYRIGSSVEFDWCGVRSVRALREMGYKTIVVNYNPETVSTDYDECDILFFEEISLERVLDIYEVEQCRQVRHGSTDAPALFMMTARLFG